MLKSPTVRCYVHALVRQDLSHPALPPPSELCIQLLLLLPVPAEVLTRSIRWSMDWQRTGCLTLSRQLQGSNNPPVVGTESDNPRVMSVIESVSLLGCLSSEFTYMANSALVPDGVSR